MKLYTTTEAATLLDAGHSTVTLHARKLGFAKHGSDYWFTETELDALRESIHERPGRPKLPPPVIDMPNE